MAGERGYSWRVEGRKIRLVLPQPDVEPVLIDITDEEVRALRELRATLNPETREVEILQTAVEAAEENIRAGLGLAMQGAATRYGEDVALAALRSVAGSELAEPDVLVTR